VQSPTNEAAVERDGSRHPRSALRSSDGRRAVRPGAAESHHRPQEDCQRQHTDTGGHEPANHVATLPVKSWTLLQQSAAAAAHSDVVESTKSESEYESESFASESESESLEKDSSPSP